MSVHEKFNEKKRKSGRNKRTFCTLLFVDAKTKIRFISWKKEIFISISNWKRNKLDEIFKFLKFFALKCIQESYDGSGELWQNISVDLWSFEELWINYVDSKKLQFLPKAKSSDITHKSSPKVSLWKEQKKIMMKE